MQVVILSSKYIMDYTGFSFCHKMYVELAIFFHGLQAITVFLYLLLSKKSERARKNGSVCRRGSGKNCLSFFPGSLSTILGFVEDLSLQRELICSSVLYSSYL